MRDADGRAVPVPHYRGKAIRKGTVRAIIREIGSFEPVLWDYKPNWVIVPSDVNSTVACALRRQDDRGLAASK